MKAEDRRQAFLDAAHDIVLEHGAEALTMDAIIARSDVTKPMLYRFFANKDEVLVALYKQTGQGLDVRITTALDGLQTFEDRMKAVIDVWLEHMETGGDLPSLMQARTKSGDLEKLREQRIIGIVNFFAEELKRGKNLSAREAPLAAAVLVASSQGFVAVLQNSNLPKKALVDMFFRMSMGAVDALKS